VKSALHISSSPAAYSIGNDEDKHAQGMEDGFGWRADFCGGRVAKELYNAIVEVAQKFGQGVDVAIGAGVDMEYVQYGSLLPEGCVEQNNRSDIDCERATDGA